jgi:hypothetical protein
MIIVAVKLFCYSHITNLGKIVLQMGCSDEIIQQNDNCNEGGGEGCEKTSLPAFLILSPVEQLYILI